MTSRPRQKVRPRLELLEDRTAPAIGLGWAFGLGSTASDYPHSLASDAAGNVYISGYFSGQVDFDPGPGTFILDSGGSEADFAAKYSSTGAFVWAARVPPYGDPWDIAADSQGNAYVVGDLVGNGDVFITKFDLTGTVIWTRTMGGAGWDVGASIALDGADNLYVTGAFEGTAAFGPFTLTSTGPVSSFATKLDADGNFLWAKGTQGTGENGSSGPAEWEIAVDGTGSAWVMNIFKGTVDFDPGPGTFNLTSMNGSWDAFIWRLSTNGDFLWAGSVGSKGTDGIGGIAVDGLNNVYFSGNVASKPNDVNPGAGSAAVNPGMFVVKLDANAIFVWAKGGVAAGPRDMVVDASGNVYTTGGFSGTVDFDPSNGRYNLTSAGSHDVFVWKLTSTGNLAEAVRIGGAAFDYGRGVGLNSSGQICLAGYFGATVDFDPGPGTYNLTSAGANDIFIAKLTQGGALLAASTPPRARSATLTAADAHPLLAAALARWTAAGFDTSALGTIQLQVANLGGRTLGLGLGETIFIDDNAAGWGWFVDRTPGEDSEFVRKGNQGEQNRMDLLTALAHEVGHLLGLDHDESGVMNETLAAGTRLVASDYSLTNAIFASDILTGKRHRWL